MAEHQNHTWRGRRIAELKAGLGRAFPDHWAVFLGEMILYSFIILLVTGVYLSVHFNPSSALVQYRGSYVPLQGLSMSAAYDSTLNISFDVRGGLLVRQVHHWAALVFVAATFVHLMRVFFTGAFRKPRRLAWVCGVLLLILGMVGGLTGYDLPDDQLSGTGLAVLDGTLVAVPFVGGPLSRALFGGAFPGHALVEHLNLVHVVVIPVLMTGLLAVYVVLALRHRPMQYPGPGRTERNVVGPPFRVHAVKSAGLSLMMSGFLVVVAGAAQVNPVWLYGPYRAEQASAGSQPDWYMGFMDGLLRVMPGWEVHVWGHTLALDVLIPLAAGSGLLLALGAYPFLEAWLTPDDRPHHLLDRPRNRPVRTALGAAWISTYLVALVGAANDVIAIRFDLSVNDVTWAVRVGLFAVPAVVLVVAKRWALALQRRDREKVLHGRETGVIKRLTHGEYIELHEPLSQARLHELTAHVQYEPLASPPAAGPAGMSRLTWGLRARLSRGLYGPGTQIPKAAADEYQKAVTPGR